MDDAPLIRPADEPFTLFDAWMRAAAAKEALAEAMSLATVAPTGRAAVRMVLLKGYGPDGFVFYTNSHSRKGQELAGHPYGALCLYWKSTARQVRIEGAIAPVTDAEADAYFASRPRESQLGAWASLQSEDLPARATLIGRYQAAEARYAGKPVPRPAHWLGYRLTPDLVEFWQEAPNRLHDRLLYERDGGGPWQWRRLYP
jgi:pyridoxamine 5'-phosphate oxidase